MCAKAWSHKQPQSSRETVKDKGSVKAMVEPRLLLEHCVETTISIYLHSSLRPGSSSKILLPFPSHRIYLVSPKFFTPLASSTVLLFHIFSVPPA